MKVVLNGLVFVLYLLAGTHAIPSWRVSLLGFSTPLSIFVFYIIILVIVCKIIGDRFKIKLSPSLFAAFMFYYFSIVLSSNFATAIDSEVLFKWLFFPLMPICISMIANRLSLIKYALLLFMISGFCVFLYGIYGYISWDVGDPLQHTLGYFGVTYEESSRNGDMLYLQSTFWILLAISLHADKVNKPIRILCGILATLVALGLVLSLARGAWIASIITVFAAILMQHTLKKKHGIPQAKLLRTKLVIVSLCIFSLMYVFLSIIGDEYFELLLSRTDSISTLSEEGGNSNLARTRLLIETSKIAVLHPLGIGVWNLKYHLDNFYMSGLASAENIYFQLVAEQGVIGLVSYLFILIWTAKRLFLYLIIIKQSPDAWVGWCLMYILINLAAYGLFNIMIEILWYWLSISLAVAMANIVEGSYRVKVTTAQCTKIEPVLT